MPLELVRTSSERAAANRQGMHRFTYVIGERCRLGARDHMHGIVPSTVSDPVAVIDLNPCHSRSPQIQRRLYGHLRTPQAFDDVASALLG